MRLGCQTFTWEMLGDGFTGSTDDILDAIAAAGYEGIEITDTMIGPYAGEPERFAAALDRRGLTLVAFAWASPTGFTDPDEAEQDVERAMPWLDFAGRFGGAAFSLGSATAHRGGTAAAGIDCAATIYNAIGERGRGMGVPVAVHPSSHHGSVLTVLDEYQRLMDRLEPGLVAWVPDTGHILKGGMDVRDALRRWRDRIAYVHLKDATADGRWKLMGEGEVGIEAVIACLHDELGFDGWLVGEEEAPEAGDDPAAAVARNQRLLAAIVR
jgi:inosose dehydratase